MLWKRSKVIRKQGKDFFLYNKFRGEPKGGKSRRAELNDGWRANSVITIEYAVGSRQ